MKVLDSERLSISDSQTALGFMVANLQSWQLEAARQQRTAAWQLLGNASVIASTVLLLTSMPLAPLGLYESMACGCAKQ